MSNSVLDIPDWLAPAYAPDLTPVDHDQLVEQGRQDRKHLQLHQFEITFERVIEHIAAGNPLSAALEAMPYDLDYGKYLQWILKDEGRKSSYYGAQEMGAEIIADQMIKISDADDSLEDVARSTLRINTRKWLLGVWNRKRFGEVKQIEQNVTIDLGEAMRVAQERVDTRRTIDVNARMING